MDRVGEFGSWWAPGGDPNVSSAIFGRIIRVSENSSPRRLRRDHKIRDRSHDCGPAHRWSLISDAYPGICLSLGMPNMAVPILIITGPVAVSVRLLPSSSFPRVGMPSVSSESPGFLEAVAAVVAAALFHARRVYPEFRHKLYLAWPF